MPDYRVLQPFRYLGVEYMPGDTITGEEFGPPAEIHWGLRLQALAEVEGSSGGPDPPVEPPVEPEPEPEPEPSPGEPVPPISTSDAPIRGPVRRR